MVGRLVILITGAQYMNFNHLQYETDFYIRKYGYLSQERGIEGSLWDKKMEEEEE